MRFMMIVKANKDSEAGKLPSEELLSAMGKYNEELMKAGVMVDGAGLQSSSKGARVKFSGGKRTVTDGPFAETKEQVGGYYVIEANDLHEAIQVAGKIPGARLGCVEVRPIADDPETLTLGLDAEPRSSRAKP